MTKHEQAAIMEHLIASFMRIKSISASGEIDRLCLDGINKAYKFCEVSKLQGQLDIITRRRHELN